MCGIFGYVGTRNTAGELVLDGLKKLEYRGYDSWGVAVRQDGDTLGIKKDVGKIGEVVNASIGLAEGCVAMGHTRWATHGEVLEKNAHPHDDSDQKIAVVHNGIVENHDAIRDRLIDQGYSFVSDTDTEVIPQLIRYYIDSEGLNFEDATRSALKEIEGRFAIVVMMHGEDMLIAARQGSPLIIGVGENEYFISSDVPAFLEYTHDVKYLDDGEVVIARPGELTFSSLETGADIEKRLVTIDWDVEEAEKGEHPHFMIKEIREQKDTIHRALNQEPELLEKLAQVISDAYGVFFVGCGTAGKVCLAAEYAFSEIAQKHVNVVFGSEFRSHHHFLKEKGLFIAISQSGETADTLEALEVAKSKGMTTLAIVNVESSTMARMSDYVLPLRVGPEKAVASTKATTAQLALAIMLAYGVAGRFEEGHHSLIRTVAAINDMLNPRYEEHIYELAQKLHSHESMYVIGKGVNYSMALEAAIKIQEVSYIHAEGFAGGELKHGPLALIGKGTPAIALVAEDDTKGDILSNATEIKSRGGYIIGVSPTNSDVFDYWLKVPDVGGPASSIVNIIPIQILAYHMGVLRGIDPDHPRNLAKSVTVK